MDKQYSLLASKEIIWVYYILPILGFVFDFDDLGVLFCIVPLILAYFTKGKAIREENQLVSSHAKWYIRTFWYSLAIAGMGIIIAKILLFINGNSIYSLMELDLDDYLLFGKNQAYNLIAMPLKIGLGIIFLSVFVNFVRLVYGMIFLFQNKNIKYKTKEVPA